LTTLLEFLDPSGKITIGIRNIKNPIFVCFCFRLEKSTRDDDNNNDDDNDDDDDASLPIVVALPG
jgi:hypothetical protein